MLLLGAPGCNSSGPVQDGTGGSGGETDTRGGGEGTGTSDEGGETTGASATGDDGSTSASATTGPGDESSSESGGESGTLPLPPAVTCRPTADACVEAMPVEGLRASHRKDYYLPENVYNEVGEVPLQGGRFHIAGVAAVSGEVTSVAIDGEQVESLLVEPRMEWYHVWPRNAVAGEPIWVAFHSQEEKWDQVEAARLTVQTTEGTAIDADFPVETTSVPLTYVTTSEDRTELLVHLRNEDSQPHTVSALIVDGVDVLAAGIACVPDSTLQPGASAMWRVPLCGEAELGQAWTVAVEFEDTPTAVGVGRVLRPFFPIEAWPVGDECPYPDVQQENFGRHMDAGFDTMFSYWGTGNSCGFSSSQMYNETAVGIEDFEIFIADDFLVQPAPETLLTDTSSIAGFLTGDETDDAIYVDGQPQPQIRAEMARRLWDMYPELTVYNGAKTNKKIGAFAGQVDVQGIDLYVAACAPHITQFGNHPPLRGAYDYLRNARNNHMPQPTWLYAQGLHSGWNKNGLAGEIHVQPDPQEIEVQAMSVAAAGGKGLMWFQTSLEEADHDPSRWQAISDMNWTFRGVRRFLREGDITGRATTAGEAIVEAIVAPDAIIVPVINLSHTSAPDDIACLTSFISEDSVPHWILAPQTLDVFVDVPADQGVVEVFEIEAGALIDVDEPVSVSGRQIRIDALELDNETPVRLLVLAAHEDVRDQVEAELARR